MFDKSVLKKCFIRLVSSIILLDKKLKLFEEKGKVFQLKIKAKLVEFDVN